MSKLGLSFRLSAYYAALFTAVGAHMPFWPLWLKSKGLSAMEIGLIMAATYLTKIVVGPAIGHVADHYGDRRRLMVILAGGATLTWALFTQADSFWAILAVTTLAVSLWTGIFPLGENLAMMTTQRHHIDYGRVRLWGSLTFIGSAVAVGGLLTHQPPAVLIWVVGGGLGLTALACLGLPASEATGRPHQPVRLWPLLKNPLFLAFLAVTSLNTASHTVYYAFATIHWQGAGIDGDVIGLLWAEGVIAEVALFAFSGRVVGKFGPGRLLAVACGAGIVRWLVLGTSTALPALIMVQGLHAATFGCAHLGAMHFIQRAIPTALSARAQGMLSAVAMGLAPAIMSPLAGSLYDAMAGQAFFVMVALSAAGLVLAIGLSRKWNGHAIV